MHTLQLTCSLKNLSTYQTGFSENQQDHFVVSLMHMLMLNVKNKNGHPLGRIQMHANGSSKLHTRDLFYRFLNLSWDTTHKSASTSSSTPTGGTSYFSFRYNCKGNFKSRACASTLVCEGNDVTCITCCHYPHSVKFFLMISNAIVLLQ